MRCLFQIDIGIERLNVVSSGFCISGLNHLCELIGGLLKAANLRIGFEFLGCLFYNSLYFLYVCHII